jgi:hypothetical protein
VRDNVQLIFLIAAIGNYLTIRSYNGKCSQAHIVYSAMKRGQDDWSSLFGCFARSLATFSAPVHRMSRA